LSVVTLGETLRTAIQRIDRIDAQYLLCHLLGVTRAYLVAHDDRKLTDAECAAYAALITRRERGEPIAQITGQREFYGRLFHINADVLIPRPETEILIDQTLARLSSKNSLKMPVDRRLSLFDLGTGSGAIAITLALEAAAYQPDITAVDRSIAALNVARANALTMGANITFLESDWYSALRGLVEPRADMIVSNPPYVAKDDPHLSQGDLRFEPHMALTDDSADGLNAIRTLVSGAHQHLHNDGWLIFEHGYDQAEHCRALMEQAGFTLVESVNDLAGIARVTLGQLCL
jgi:release factor glutamine methyltransferase